MTSTATQQSGRAKSSVPVYRINVAQSCALLEEHIKMHNQSAKVKIKAVHFALAKKLLELYARRFADWQMKNSYTFTPDTPLPLLSINNESLAEWLVCTDRTVRNYRARMADIHFITETIWHGTARPYEVRINPAFLYLACNAHTERVTLPNGRIFPLTGSGYPKQELTGTVCGKKPEPTATPVIEPELPAETVPEPQEPKNRNESHEDKAPLGATGTRTGTPPPCGAPPAPDASSRTERQVARVFLAAALPLLYGKKYWTAAEKGRIEAQAARLFVGLDESRLQRVLDNYHVRCRMAALHYQRVSGVPLPHPELFFNPDVEAGFVATRNWPQYPEQFPIPRTQGMHRIRFKPTDDRANGQMTIGELVNQLG